MVVQNILGERDDEMTNDTTEEESPSRQYYVKFMNRAHIHNRWMGEEDITELEGGESALRRYQGRLERNGLTPSLSIPSLLAVDDSQVNSFWFDVDRILDEKGEGNRRRYFVKWKLLGYDEATWEKEQDLPEDAIKQFHKRLDHSNPKKIPKRWRRPRPETFVAEKEPIQSKFGDTLRSYQMEGYNWLRFCWYNKRNSILADEMGLGKTAQIVTVLQSLAAKEGIGGPFLVVAPLSTLEHWKNEFERWSDLNAFIYHGNHKARDVIRGTEFVAVDVDGEPLNNRVQFDTVITNYETMLQDFSIFLGIEWRYLVVDEAHKLKNSKGKLYQKMETLTYEHCSMLTGTPIQNCIEELWGLLHFLYPERFSDLEEFTDRYGNTSDSAQVLEIQEIIQPIMLRRKKSDVEKSILPKEETIIEVELTREQKKFYRGFLHENAGTLLQTITGGTIPSLLNLMMQLRKVCNHPYLIKGAEDEIVKEKRAELGDTMSRRQIEMLCMVESSGKMIFIDKLLPKLREGGHKVLIFSQMVRVLSIIQDYLNYKGYPFLRLDGSVGEDRRQTSIEHFNSDEDAFVFLLSTRAGGVGINLTAADTVIIYDSDWNPQNDIQAQARCHRIGQKATVKVYRLITRGTYENKMFERASRKLGLDHVVLDGGDMSRDAKPMKATEIEEMLRHGVHGIFNEDDTEADRFCAADIDQILERRAKVCTSDVISGGGSIFAKATFHGDTDTLDLNAADFWSQVLPGQNTRMHEPIAIRRCRQQKMELAFTFELSEGVSSVRRVVHHLLDRGYRSQPGELEVVKYSLTFCEIADAKLNPVVDQMIGKRVREDDEESDDGDDNNEAFASVIGVKGAAIIEKKSAKIIEQVLFFGRLRRTLYFIQEAPIEWPAILPLWEDPVAEYALAVAVDRYGWHDLPANIDDPQLGLKKTKPLKKHQIQKRLTQMMDEVEPGMPPGFPLPPDSFDPMIPARWKELHPNVLARSTLCDHEIVAVFQALLSMGLPVDSDWSQIREKANLGLVTVDAVKSVGEELVRLANSVSEDVDFAGFPLLEPAMDQLNARELRKLASVVRDMGEIHNFLAKLSQRRTDLLKQIDRPNNGPDWWTWECDRALIVGIAENGTIRFGRWLIDRQLPFRKHFGKPLVEALERVAEAQDKGKKSKLVCELPEDFAWIFRARSRMSRALSVINSVKRLAKRQPEPGDSSQPGKRGRRKRDSPFPMSVGGGLSILSLGSLVPGFESGVTPYPVGFVSRRGYKMPDWTAKVKFKSEIIDKGGRPSFRVTCLAGPVAEIEADDPSDAWRLAIDAVAQRVPKDKAVTMTPEDMQRKRVSGNVLFGLCNKKVIQELLKMDRADEMNSLKRRFPEKVDLAPQPFEIRLPVFATNE
jgi:SNF2 family DNA or RNA helicase